MDESDALGGDLRLARVSVQLATDGSTETMSMGDLTAKLENVFSQEVADSESGYSTEATNPCCFVDQMYFPEVATQGELRVTMIRDTPFEIQKRMPAKGGFSATFKAGAKFEKCPQEDEAWGRARAALGTLEGLTEAVGCAKGTPLPLLWAVELLPYAGSGCVVGEIDCGCIGVATSAHLIPDIADAAIALARSTGGAE